MSAKRLGLLNQYVQLELVRIDDLNDVDLASKLRVSLFSLALRDSEQRLSTVLARMGKGRLCGVSMEVAAMDCSWRREKNGPTFWSDRVRIS